jgi:signal-transduction protein with cAMP-binding, CBS, and nucleotidyltransferase domain
MMERKRNLIHEMTKSAYSLFEYYHSLEKSGVMGSEEAKEAAKSAINALRYGEALKDYFWITDRHPRMIMHPYRPELNGADLSNYKDSMGKAIFVEFAEAVSLSGESYIDYMWQWNDDSTRVVPKLSYVRLFEPWDWIIGTGIYIEDVRIEIRGMEVRALTISGVIGLLILLLLIIMARQGHRIEAERSHAEEELHKSKELYRTLAEAASEGVLIWSSKGLQANKTLLSWLNYSEQELPQNSIRDIISSSLLSGFENAGHFYDLLSVRMHAECMLIQKDRTLLKCYADFSRIQLGGLNAVLVVIRPLKSFTPQTGIEIPWDLLKNIETGFFRTSYGKSFRFIAATPSAISMLGFDDFDEMTSLNLDALFVEARQLKEIKDRLANTQEAKAKAVALKGKNGRSFQALVSALTVENSEGEVSCEWSIEPLAAIALESGCGLTDVNQYSASYILKSPISVIAQPIETVSQATGILKVLSLLNKQDAPFAVVVDDNNEPLGIIDAGKTGVELSVGGDPNTPAGFWMKTPLSFIRNHESISVSLNMIQSNPAGCLLAVDGEKRLTGYISPAILARALASSPNPILQHIEEATTVSALQKAFLDSREFVGSMAIGNADISEITCWFSSIADLISQKTLSMCLEAMGPPPCKFAFFQTGSAGRMEQTLSTDQDNAIVFEDRSKAENESAQQYFTELGNRVNTMLDEIGFSLCKGNNMAGNTKWCQPLSRWKSYFSEWISSPGPEELLEVSIFFDFRFCYGEKVLIDELRDYVSSRLKTNDIFFRFMAIALKSFTPSLHLVSKEKTDTKRLLMPLTGAIRLYALKNGITPTATIDRLIALYRDGSIEPGLFRGLIRAWKNLTTIRLMHQTENLRKGLEPDNMVNFQLEAVDFRYQAEEAIESIHALMLKTGSEFYTEPI